LRDAKQAVIDYSGELSKSVTFAVTNDNISTKLLCDFMIQHRDYYIEQYMHAEHDAFTLLEEGHLDFVLTSGKIQCKSKNIYWQELKKENLYLLASESHKLSPQNPISLEKMKKYEYIMEKSAFQVRGRGYDFFESIGFQPEIRFVTNEFEVMIALVELDVGACIVSEETAKKLLSNSKRRLSAAPIDTELASQIIGIASLKGHYMTRAAKCLYDFTVSYFRDSEPLVNLMIN
ncbi:MAG: LysR family transcriptional regulator substrate-binding protein, partial [Lachnospiraceae bacterium]|nr:LysR family transcriptional regulator substrate-binding protein [Lachnospiraceae bacterium]